MLHSCAIYGRRTNTQIQIRTLGVGIDWYNNWRQPQQLQRRALLVVLNLNNQLCHCINIVETKTCYVVWKMNEDEVVLVDQS